MREHNLQVRHVPEDVHRQLKVRAARAGLTLSAYVLAELAVIARRPTLDEVLDTIRHRDRVQLREDVATAVRAERQSRS